MKPFGKSNLRAAQDVKLELELALHRRGVEREVVLIEAESEDELRRAYRRYFEDLPTLLQSVIDQVRAMRP